MLDTIRNKLNRLLVCLFIIACRVSSNINPLSAGSLTVFWMVMSHSVNISFTKRVRVYVSEGLWLQRDWKMGYNTACPRGVWMWAKWMGCFSDQGEHLVTSVAIHSLYPCTHTHTFIHFINFLICNYGKSGFRLSSPRIRRKYIIQLGNLPWNKLTGKIHEDLYV